MVKNTIKDAIELAESKNGLCISNEYYGADAKLVWQCNIGHIWEARYRTIARGHWCPKCGRISASKKRIKYNIEDLRIAASKRQGKCLSTAYLGYGADHVWQCYDGHTWNAPPDRIIQGKWCPKCAKRKHFTEEKCRYIVEQMTGLSFPPDKKMLGGLEIDLYNCVYKLGIEYNGVQHYRFVKAWHRNHKGFKACQDRDRRTKQKCEELGIDLRIVSYLDSKSDDCLVSKLKRILADWGLPTIVDEVDFKPFYKNLSSLCDLKKKAVICGGRCLSAEYVDSGTKCRFQCKKGHVFNMEPRHVNSGHWCGQCGNEAIGDKNRKLCLFDAQGLARQRGGKCLSKSYKSTSATMKWECSQGHVWEAPFSSIRAGKWCNKCGGQITAKKLRGSIDKVKYVAESRGGKCISLPEEYVNNRTKLEFECEYGHRWLARPGNIQQGKWCPCCK